MRARLKDFWVVVLLIAVTGLLYAGTFRNEFVYDDQVTIVENLFIRDFGNLRQFFTRDYYLLSEEYSFRPLVTLTYFLDYSWWNANPWGYHLTNLLLHAAVAAAGYLFALLLFGNRRPAIFAALCFAVHPAQTEAVAGISFREDLLCALFYYLAIIFFLLGRKKICSRQLRPAGQERLDPRPVRPFYLMLSLACFLLALLSKENAVALPLVLLAYMLTVVRRERPGRPGSILVGWGIPALYFCIAAIFVFLRFKILYHRGTLPTAPDFGDVPTRLMLAAKSLGLYGRLLFFPFNLSIEYPDPFPSISWGGYLLFPAFLTLALLLSCFLREKERRVGTFGLAFFVLSLLPLLNLVPSSRIGADRFFYLPALGGFIWAADLLFGAPAGGKTRLPGTVPLAVLILIFWSLGTWQRNREWRDNLALFTRAAAVSPSSSKARHGLGNELFRRGRLREAEWELKAAIEIFPREPLYHNSLGVVYGEMGEYQQAERAFRESARLNPGDPLVNMNLSTLYIRLGDLDRATEEIMRFIALRSFDPKGYLNLGEICLKREDYASAINAYRNALRLDPYSVLALSNLGYCYFRAKEFLSARRAWESALRLDPNNVEIRMNLDSLRKLGR